MEEHLSFKAEPRISPTATAAHILVVGGGVTGLVTSWILLDRGYKVTVMSKQWASDKKEQRLTSQIAGALWEFPPAVCGQHTDHISVQLSKRWCMLAYRVWDAIAADPDLSRASGVRMKKSAFFFPYRVEEDKEQYQKMLEIESSGVRGFHHSKSLIEDYGVSSEYGCVDAYELLAPIIDTDQAMSWLMGLIASKGAEFVSEAVEGDIFDCEHELHQRFKTDVIVNTTGLASIQLAGDTSCYPIRGATIRIINDGGKFEKVDSALCISADARHASGKATEFVFILPRSDRILLLGGISEPYQWKLDYTLDSDIIRRMKERCEEFLPRLKHAHLDDDYPLAQGLRPFRECNVRVERELRRHEPCSDSPAKSGHQSGTGSADSTDDASAASRIAHSYGHGGSGWSLSFGCAEDVLGLVEEILAGKPPRQAAQQANGYLSLGGNHLGGKD
ncbi:FAD dependent oxidoreductase [Diplogelasinospora grovesii]|uniref:FAD dependent oxidoreductase n=1 Tax=Diplogelasinospora grovesii TaxID=303347 RepID=A0AAN6RZA5_9PEZI|nr:FAD dependent oxidoreductase [Diplogelasinospora grovesii]